jgi:hypothetical protein
MKTIKQDELFQHLGGFLKSKGVEFTDGSYAQRIRQGCNLLTDAVNATQKTMRTAKVEVDKKLDQLRQTIHEATAPKPPPAKPTPEPQPAAKPEAKKPQAKRGKADAKSGKAKARQNANPALRRQR